MEVLTLTYGISSRYIGTRWNAWWCTTRRSYNPLRSGSLLHSLQLISSKYGLSMSSMRTCSLLSPFCLIYTSRMSRQSSPYPLTSAYKSWIIFIDFVMQEIYNFKPFTTTIAKTSVKPMRSDTALYVATNDGFLQVFPAWIKCWELEKKNSRRRSGRHHTLLT